jgi:hypothetical protein
MALIGRALKGGGVFSDLIPGLIAVAPETPH